MRHETERCREVSRHGVVTAVNGAVADIEIIQRSACSSCHIRALCAAGESSSKLIQAPNDGTLAPGMSVILSMDERIGWLGVLVGFVLPLVLVVSTLFVVRGLIPREEIAGLIAVTTLVPYYGIVHLFRGFFSRVVRFRVERPPIGRHGPAAESDAAHPHPFHIVQKEGTL